MTSKNLPERERVEYWHRFPRDDEWRKVTLGGQAAHGYKLQPMCKACQHRGDVFDPVDFSARYAIPMERAILTIQTQLRCTKCCLPAGYFYWWNPSIPMHR